ncbi:FAD-dependent oxidoreductase [Nostoc sp. CHAB 5784]|uniref:FAD-dependent oxidoreductase n=1 Tax=Nostoc mirabile TaxID=2907820 RepID=UPI001E4DE9EF|nr:FAD-dependent oxidoreductase [Nostoc mirabile]MCC5664986.1 FAD-dependent oxidoreductase [Nostoc mirabile CHAB5784]
MDTIIDYLARGLAIQLSEVLFILGSYARLLVGATGLESRQLSQPIAGRVYFAGEAVHPTDPGTVHGAFWSGEQAVCALEHQFNEEALGWGLKAWGK